MENSGIKKRVGWLKGKPIMEGDKNIVTSNEIHINNLISSSSSGSGENIYYYNIYNINPLVYYSNKVKVKFEGDATWITSSCKWIYEYPESSSERYVVSAIAVQYPIEDYLTGDTTLILNNLEEVVSFFDLNISDFTPITKEEFYSLEA